MFCNFCEKFENSKWPPEGLPYTNNCPCGTLNNHDVERVQVTKFLGVIIDKKLTWKYHLAHMSGKINKNISLSIKERNL